MSQRDRVAYDSAARSVNVLIESFRAKLARVTNDFIRIIT